MKEKIINITIITFIKFIIKVSKYKFRVFSKIPKDKNISITQFPQNKIELGSESINHDAVRNN